ncbi:MAG TPA: DUF1616 domain-containing protein [Thermoplasmata archaeon]|nr:DUF1616 domain-containing protein [Thermoplasmata archaeon]
MSAGAAETTGPVPDFFRPDYLFLLAGLSLAFLIVSLVAPTPWLELPLGLVTLLIAPGYAVGSLLFRGRPNLPSPASLAIVVGLSVTLNGLLGIGTLEFHAGVPAPFFAGVAFLLSLLALGVRLQSVGPVSGHLRKLIEREFYLPGRTRRQRGATYTLLALIAVVLMVIVYLSLVHPNVHPAVALALAGVGGSVVTLPSEGQVGQVLDLWVTVTNNASAQQLLLVVQSVNESANPVKFNVIAWTLPLHLANATQSSDAFNLQPQQSYTLNLTFSYSYPGTYALSFYLSDSAGTTLRTSALSLQIL